jgi:hypothetical protein
MLGLSFGKIVVLVALAAAVWLAYRYMKLKTPPAPPATRPPPATPGTQDLTRCPTCGAYVAVACARADCGFGRGS